MTNGLATEQTNRASRSDYVKKSIWITTITGRAPDAI